MPNLNPIKLVGNAAKALVSYGDQALTAIGLKDKEPASYSRGPDGQISHNVDLSEFPADLKQQAEQLIGDMVRDIEAKRQDVLDARAAGDTQLETRLKDELDSLNGALTDVKFELEHVDPDLATLGSLMSPAGLIGLAAEGGRWNSKLADSVEDALEAAGKLDSATGAGGSASASASSETAQASSDMAFKDVDSAVALFENDPEAFFQKMSELPSEERGQWLMMIQQEIQQTNQLISALTNFQKAQHDTQKAVLANIRV